MARSAAPRVSYAFLAVLVFSTAASAQSIITGTVRDVSGASMPGVTVEAASPVLIEKVKSVVSDGNGSYRITDLRPGVYTVTFTLTGFSTFRRDGLELPADFTATLPPLFRSRDARAVVEQQRRAIVAEPVFVLGRRSGIRREDVVSGERGREREDAGDHRAE